MRSNQSIAAALKAEKEAREAQVEKDRLDKERLATEAEGQRKEMEKELADLRQALTTRDTVEDSSLREQTRKWVGDYKHQCKEPLTTTRASELQNLYIDIIMIRRAVSVLAAKKTVEVRDLVEEVEGYVRAAAKKSNEEYERLEKEKLESGKEALNNVLKARDMAEESSLVTRLTKWMKDYDRKQEEPPSTERALNFEHLHAEIVAINTAIVDLAARGNLDIADTLKAADESMLKAARTKITEQARMESERGRARLPSR